jgi:hypothetical protein
VFTSLCLLCSYYGSIVHVVNNCINSDEAQVLYDYGFIAKLLVDMMRSV